MDVNAIIKSLDPSANVKQIQNAGLGAGASGMFFFKSHDKKFILKTMTPGDLKETRRTLQHHYLHMSKEPASLISRIYGVFTIKMDAFSPVHVMIMENCLEEVPGYSLDHVFDIKGSEFSREVLNKTPSSVLEK